MRFAQQMMVTAALAGLMVMAPSSSPVVIAQMPPVRLVPAAAVQDDADANQALAERVAQTAQMTLSSSTMASATLRQSATMFEAANRLAPTEPRFLRLLTECYLQLGGEEGRAGAIKSLTRYLNLKLKEPDYGAQCQLIDLHYSELQTADARKKYIDDLLTTEGLSVDVRSYVAVMGARLAFDRAAPNEAKKYIGFALKIFPLCPEALELSYRQLDADAPPPQRVALMLQMLQSNPAQPQIMLDLAQELAEAGVVDASLAWYQNARQLLNERMMVAAPQDVVDTNAAELVIADQLLAANETAKSVLERDPGDVTAAFIALLSEKRGGDADKIKSASDATKKALMQRLSGISAALNGVPIPAAPAAGGAAATQPADVGALPPPVAGAAAPALPPADIDADLKKLLDQKDTDIAMDYASTIADLAWLEIYFNRKASDAAPYLAALHQLLPADNVVLTRLDGWSFLVDDKKPEAKVKLEAVADRDPLAALGMLLIEEKPALEQTAAAKKLLNANPTGLVGAILMESLRSKVGLMPSSADAIAIRAELAKFPGDYLDLLDKTKTPNFYIIKGVPLKVSHAFGEPILANVTIQNKSPYVLTIGPNGVIHPDLWIDAQLRGIVQDSIPGVAFDRVTQRKFLAPKESLTITMRVDQGQLINTLNANPVVSMPIFFSVLTNPMTQQTGIAPGPCGYRVVFTQAERAPTKIDAIPAVLSQLQLGSGAVRIRTIDLLAAFSHLLMSQPDIAMKNRGQQIADVIRNSVGDRSEAVRAEASLVTAMLSESSVREGLISQMLTDKSFQQRLMGMIAAQLGIEAPKRKELFQSMADNDPDDLVKKLASAMIEVADLPQPTTQPGATTNPSVADVLGAMSPPTTAPSANAGK